MSDSEFDRRLSIVETDVRDLKKNNDRLNFDIVSIKNSLNNIEDGIEKMNAEKERTASEHSKTLRSINDKFKDIEALLQPSKDFNWFMEFINDLRNNIFKKIVKSIIVATIIIISAAFVISGLNILMIKLMK